MNTSDLNELIATAEHTDRLAMDRLRTILAGYGVDEHDAIERMCSRTQALLTKHLYAKDGDGTVPADLTTAAHLAGDLMEMRQYLPALRREPKANSLFTLQDAIDRRTDAVARVRRYVADLSSNLR